MSFPGFFQAKMESILSRYLWDFILVYIDDIIIYNCDINEHLRHLDTMLEILQASGIILFLSKCHFTYPSVKLLGHYISQLSITTTDDKVAAVHRMRFPTTVGGLETGVAFFNYYQRFVECFALIAKLLHKLKALRLRAGPKKDQPQKHFINRTLVTSPQDDDELHQLVFQSMEA